MWFCMPVGKNMIHPNGNLENLNLNKIKILTGNLANQFKKRPGFAWKCWGNPSRDDSFQPAVVWKIAKRFLSLPQPPPPNNSYWPHTNTYKHRPQQENTSNGTFGCYFRHKYYLFSRSPNGNRFHKFVHRRRNTKPIKNRSNRPENSEKTIPSNAVPTHTLKPTEVGCDAVGEKLWSIFLIDDDESKWRVWQICQAGTRLKKITILG